MRFETKEILTVVLIINLSNWFWIFGINHNKMPTGMHGTPKCCENFLIPKVKSDNSWCFPNAQLPLRFGNIWWRNTSNQGKASSTVWGSHLDPWRYLTWTLVILTFLVLVSNVWLQQSNFKTSQYIRNHE